MVVLNEGLEFLAYQWQAEFPSQTGSEFNFLYLLLLGNSFMKCCMAAFSRENGGALGWE